LRNLAKYWFEANSDEIELQNGSNNVITITLPKKSHWKLRHKLFPIWPLIIKFLATPVVYVHLTAFSHWLFNIRYKMHSIELA